MSVSRPIPVELYGGPRHVTIRVFYGPELTADEVRAADASLRARLAATGLSFRADEYILRIRLATLNSGRTVTYWWAGMDDERLDEPARVTHAETLAAVFADGTFRLDPVTLIEWACADLRGNADPVAHAERRLTDPAADAALLRLARRLLLDHSSRPRRARRYLTEFPRFAARMEVAA